MWCSALLLLWYCSLSYIDFYMYCSDSVIIDTKDDFSTSTFEEKSKFENGNEGETDTVSTDNYENTKAFDVDDMAWKRISHRSHNIELFSQRSSSSLKLLAFKGTSVVNAHISNLLGVFLNNTLTAQHLNFVSEVIEFPLERDGRPELLYTSYHLPWPLRDRDSLLEKHIQVIERSRSVVATYDSITDDRMPVDSTNTCIRTDSSTHWHFRVVGNESRPQTLMTFEATVDLKGKIPVWFINYMQQSYLMTLLSSLTTTAEAYSGAPYLAVSKW
jgi:hypothetical protein